MTISSRFRRILEIPCTVCIVLGFCISYVLFFMVPNFFSTDSVQFFAYSKSVHEVQIGDTAGMDLKEVLTWSAHWLEFKNPPLAERSDYPPLASLMLAPLLGLKFSEAYKLVTLISVVSYVLLTLVVPVWIGRGKQILALPLMLCATGLLSYGLQFELERGQINVIAVLLAVLAVCIYHRYARLRFLAFVLFSISVQLKLYPLMFVVALIGDWRDWKNNLMRLSLLIGANVLLFMIRGFGAFAVFMQSLQGEGQAPYIWVGNPSIASGAVLALRYASRRGLMWLQEYTGFIETLLYLLAAACLFVIVLRAYLQKSTGIDPYLMLALVIGLLLVASVGHDYRLSLLGGPTALVFLSETAKDRTHASPPFQLLASLMIFVLALAYSSTLFSFAQKPLLLANNLPALLTMLAAVTVLALLSKPIVDAPTT